MVVVIGDRTGAEAASCRLSAGLQVFGLDFGLVFGEVWCKCESVILAYLYDCKYLQRYFVFYS